jgi:DNA-binding CsgD family transcriptional regulator
MAPQIVLVNRDPMLPFADFVLEDGSYSLGRSAECDIPILDVTISRQHAQLEVKGQQVTVSDLGSRNKTYVGGRVVEKAVACCGEEVRFGRVAFLVQCAQQYSPPPDKRESDTRIHKSDSPALHIEEMKSALTPAQLRVLACTLNGHSEKAVARKLGISHHTVHNHIRQIYHQLKVQSRAELMSLFIPLELLDHVEKSDHSRLQAKTADDILQIE